MQTDDLISLMSASSEPVDTSRLSRATWLATVTALATTILLVLLTLGARHDFSTAWMTLPVLAKAGLGAGIALVALTVFQKSLRPGLRPAGMLWLVALPIALAVGWAVLALLNAPREQWGILTLGQNWLSCLIAVPLYALCPFVFLLAVSRMGAPVDKHLTGVCAGLGSAGLAIVAYSIHCPDDAAPFLATWYLLATALIAGLSTFALPRLVRW